MALCKVPAGEEIQILLDNVEDRETATFYDKKRNMIRMPIFTQNDEKISGKVVLRPKSKQMKHLGIHVQLIGQTEIYDAVDRKHTFLLKNKEIEPAGRVVDGQEFSFSFTNFDRKLETYYGKTGRVKYYIRATIVREYKDPLKTSFEFALQLPVSSVVFNQGYDIQLRIADYLRIDFEMTKSTFHMDECIVGKITVDEIRLMIKQIQISLTKKELCNDVESPISSEEILVKKELVNKCPRKGDKIPFRLDLASLNLTPNMINLSNPRMSVKYALILSFIDEEDRSLFKPLEIQFWRKL